MNALSQAEDTIRSIQENSEKGLLPSLPVRPRLDIRYDLTSSLIKDRIANSYASLVAEFRRADSAIENLWNQYTQIREIAIRSNGEDPAIPGMIKATVDQLPVLLAQFKMTYSLGVDIFAWVLVVHEFEKGWVFSLFPIKEISPLQAECFSRMREKALRGFSRSFDEETERRGQSGFTPPIDKFEPPK